MDTIEFGSVCSGIEAASVAWHPLGWRAAWLAEIEPFPAAVLAHHYPTVPNLGDMTTIARRVLIGEVSAPDVLAGGTPCQAFSVAGLRNSLDDARGNLTLKFVELGNAIDLSRSRAGKPACVIKWENVPGVLNTKDNAFGCFLAGLAGEDDPLQPPGGKWSNAGCVYGPTRSVAWRTLDAQYFGVAQRRRRVFVVASARPGFDPAQVLFEWDGVRRDSAPSRETGEEAAGTLASRSGAGGFPGTDEACSGYLQPVECFGGNRTSGPLDVSTALNASGTASGTASGRQDFESETFVVHGSQDPGTLRDMAHTLGRNQGQENAVCVTGSVTHTLTGEGFDASEDGTGRGTPLVAIPHVDVMPTMRAGAPTGGKGHGARSGDSKDEYLVPVAFDTTQITSAANRSNPRAGDPCHPLAAGAHAPAIAYTTKLHNTGSNNAGKIFEERTPCLDACSPAPALLTASQVRRLTPVECERLQGFPDGYTQIPNWSGWRAMDANETPEQCLANGLEVKQSRKTGKWRVKDVDGPRYKALGNSWAVPVARWIGRRINTQILKLEAQHG